MMLQWASLILFFAFYAEIKDGHQKWLENKFGETSPDECEYILRVRNFDENALSLTVFEIKAFFHFMQKVKMAAKTWQENDFWKKLPCHSANTLGENISPK